jgi:hydroxyethylthiazole kinase-like uncharacterized protein yjeF
MKIFNATQLKAWDQATIERQSISSWHLMERASACFVDALQALNWNTQEVLVVCGNGNNGGDGLAIARMLKELDYKVHVLMNHNKPWSPDAEQNLIRYDEVDGKAVLYSENTAAEDLFAIFKSLPAQLVIIDALYGTGLNRPIEGIDAQLVQAMNSSGHVIVAVDVPSGLSCDEAPGQEAIIVKAQYTFTFQTIKQSFMYAASAAYLGKYHVLNIGLDPLYVHDTTTLVYTIDADMVKQMYKPRPAFSHKGTFGKAAIMAGSKGMMGAALLASEACLRSGVGLLKTIVPACGYTIVQQQLPECIVEVDDAEEEFSRVPNLAGMNALAVGPGWKESDQALSVLKALFMEVNMPMVIDAGALNLLARDVSLLQYIPMGSILTPHPKEWERLVGHNASAREAEQKAMHMAQQLGVYLILKGRHTAVVTPEAEIYYNVIGNAGMAKAGSGDCLTGILVSLLAQGYEAKHAALMGVYMHAYAGDCAALGHTQEAMLPTDLIACLSDFFEMVQK